MTNSNERKEKHRAKPVIAFASFCKKHNRINGYQVSKLRNQVGLTCDLQGCWDENKVIKVIIKPL